MSSLGLERYLVFVPNTFGPYGYEVVKILAYPGGFCFRFRFDAEWVEEKVKNRLHDLIGNEGYILLRNFSNSEFFPVRFITLSMAKKVGPIYYFECVLKEIMDVVDENARASQLATFRSRFDKFHPAMAQQNEKEKPLRPLVFLTNFEPDLNNEFYVQQDTEEQDSSRWMNIVSAMREIEYFDNVEFLRVLSLFKHTKDDEKPAVSEGAWILMEGSTYTLRVVQFIPNEKDARDLPNDISIKADKAVIDVVRGEQRAVGKYDILKFVLRVAKSPSSLFSFVDLEYQPGAALQKRIDPRISLPIQIKRSPRRIFLRVLIASIFLALYFFPSIATYIPHISNELVKDIGIVGVAIMVVDLLRCLRRRNAS